MARTDDLSPASRSAVAAKLASFITSGTANRSGVRASAAAVAASSPSLHESLAVCPLTVEQVQHPPDDLRSLVTPTGSWMHLVRTAGKPTHFARSHTGGFRAEDQAVEFAGESPIAGKLSDAVEWVDENIPDDSAVVRVLIIPAYLTHALAIVRPKKITAVLVDRPESYSGLKYEKEYSFAQFLKLLAKEKPTGMFASRPS
jgi:hypothetical protein